ncbi:MAG: hypothetical protein AB7U30_07950 [Sulfuricellaceae bacterium]|jgi:conjugal transfer ATP-binding protein TraC
MMKSIHTVPGKYSELMIKRKGDWGIVRLVENRFAQVLYSTKDSEYDAILAAMKHGMPVGEAINDFIAQEKAT